MRALFLAHAYPRYPNDPVGSFVLRLATALRTKAVDVIVLAPSAPGLAHNEIIEGIPVQRFRYAPRRFETLAYAGTMGTQVRGSWSARLALAGMLSSAFVAALRMGRRERVDLIHAHWWFPSAPITRTASRDDAARVRRALGA
jgi:hypothetical protein